MPAVSQSRQIVAGNPVHNPRGASELCQQVTDYLVPSGGLVLNAVIEMGGLAEGCIFTDAKVVCEDLDSGTTITLDGGILTGVYGDAKDTTRTCGNEFFAASTVGQAGGIVRTNKAAGLLTAPSLDVTPYGIKIAAAPTGNVVGARIRMIVDFKPAPVSV